MASLGKRTVKAVWLIALIVQVLNWIKLVSMTGLTIFSLFAVTEKTIQFLVTDEMSKMGMKIWDLMENSICKMVKKIANKIRKKKPEQETILPVYLVSEHI